MFRIEARPHQHACVEAVIGKGGANDVATQAFECLALMGGAPHIGMLAKALGANHWRVVKKLIWPPSKVFSSGYGQRKWRSAPGAPKKRVTLCSLVVG